MNFINKYDIYKFISTKLKCLNFSFKIYRSDVAYFDGLNETIISVGLVKPKAGIFQSYVKYLLILTTTVEITILGVTIPDEGGGNNLLQFYLFIFVYQ